MESLPYYLRCNTEYSYRPSLTQNSQYLNYYIILLLYNYYFIILLLSLYYDYYFNIKNCICVLGYGTYFFKCREY